MKKVLLLVGLLASTACSADGIYLQLPGISFGIGATPVTRYYYPQPRVVYDQPVYIEQRPIYYEQVVPVYRNWYGKEEHHEHHHRHHDHDRD